MDGAGPRVAVYTDLHEEASAAASSNTMAPFVRVQQTQRLS